jgi:uncharacterized protein (TIGR00304 family)
MPLTLILITVVTVGIVLAMVGTLLILLSALRAREGVEGKTEGGAVVVIGPLPLVFGTSERIAKALMVLAIALFISVLAVFLVGLLVWRGVWPWT